MKQTWKYINSAACAASKNMQIDMAILGWCIEKKSVAVLRTYDWKPYAVSVGRNQSDSNLNKGLCKRQSIEIVQRPTGGRAVVHQGDLTYCFVINSDWLEGGGSVSRSYKEISSALIEGLKLSGVEDVYISQSKQVYTKTDACMAVSTGADLEYKGRKIAGSAQLRKNGYILQHGSILVEQDFSLTAKIFNLPEESLKCINLAEIINPPPDYQTLAACIKRGFENYFNVTFQTDNKFSLPGLF